MAFTISEFSLVEGHATGTKLRQRFQYNLPTGDDPTVASYFDSVGATGTGDVKDGDLIEVWTDADVYSLYRVSDAAGPVVITAALVTG